MTEQNNDLTDDGTAAVIADIARRSVTPARLSDGDVYALIDHTGGVNLVETPGYTRRVDEDHAPQPERIHRNVAVTDVPSLLDYINEHTDDHGICTTGSGTLEVWADDNRVTAVLNGGTGWGDHTATLRLQSSPEWAAWTHADGNYYEQDVFAEFLADRLYTIAEPDGAQLLEICQTLTGRTNVKWRSQAILANGQRQFGWEEQIDAKAGDKGQLTIPDHLTLVLRPYLGSEPVAVVTRFRYRIRGGEMALGIRLQEADKTLEDAFTAVVAQVQAGVPVIVRRGTR